MGARKFLDRIYRIFEEKPIKNEINKNLEKIYHQTIKKVTTDFESLNFNTAISQMMIFINSLSKEEFINKEMFEGFLKLLNPICPFITEELWEKLGHNKTISFEPWPKFDETKLVEDTIELPIQINGKVRAKINVLKTLSEEEIKNLALQEVKSYTENGYKKLIYVKNRLINIVI